MIIFNTEPHTSYKKKIIIILYLVAKDKIFCTKLKNNHPLGLWGPIISHTEQGLCLWTLLPASYSALLYSALSCPGEVILDSATAQKNLVVSEDGRQVRYDEHKISHTDGPKRFNPALFVLGREGLTSGRHYWEVEVGRKTAWTLGVATASARRKGEIKLSPEGGYWCLWLKNGEVKALASYRLPLTLPSPITKVGIFLDYDGGQISFYDVKARLHLYSFLDTFNESLYPVFSPCLDQEGKNSSPLIITTVKHT